MKELTEADRKAIDEYLYKIDIDDFDTIYCKMTAEWGIKHARANDDPGPEWVASNILEGAAKRIKELEAEVARIREEIALFFRTNVQAPRTAFERLAKAASKPYDSPIVALQSPSSAKDTPDNLRRDLQHFMQILIARNYNNIGKWHNQVQQYNFELIIEVEKILIDNARQSSHVSVDINREWISLDEHRNPSSGIMLFATWDSKRKEFHNHMVLEPRHDRVSSVFTHYLNIPSEPPSKASPPKQSGE